MSHPSTNDIIALLEEIGRLMELKGDNPFKIRAFEKAAHALSGREDLIERARSGKLTELEGIGKGISDVITEFVLHGRSKVREELQAEVPPELVELTQVPGLGPKKAKELIEKLEIRSIAELQYACRENRLLKLKGFGPKIQDKILEGIVFLSSTQGLKRLVDVFPVAERLLPILVEVAHGQRVSETGALRRRLEILSEMDFLIEQPADEAAARKLERQVATSVDRFKSQEGSLLPIRIFYAQSRRFGYELARTTGSPEHWKALGSPTPFDAANEEDFYAKLELPLIPAEARENGEEVELARAGKLKSLLAWDGVRGVFHNHTTRSDGAATLEQMVVAAKKMGYEYIGISDHSQSAFYAHGLRPEDLKDQEKEIRAVQEKHPEIRVFWGIESDILADGSLDYDAATLKRFDFVIASIHSRFKMDKEAMTDRILHAIRHPSTRFLGHATGRLLLGRKGYDLHMEKVIEEASRHGVAIEINANPARLDIDWRWGGELRRRKTAVSINPDAHETAGLEDTRFGIAVARKALLPTDQVINSKPVKEVERWLKRA